MRDITDIQEDLDQDIKDLKALKLEVPELLADLKTIAPSDKLTAEYMEIWGCMTKSKLYDLLIDCIRLQASPDKISETDVVLAAMHLYKHSNLAEIDDLQYCKKTYPGAFAVEDANEDPID